MAADSANLALPPWRGFHHVALVTSDLDATMRFYAEALGIETMAVSVQIGAISGPAQNLYLPGLYRSH